MMKMLKLLLKSKIIYIIVFLILISNIIYASETIYNYSVESVGPIVLDDDSIVITGDSFAGKFCEYESDRELTLIPYAIAGRTTIQNQIIMAEALNMPYNRVLISIGVNDQYMGTMTYEFEQILRSLLNIARVYGKKVYFHSYLKYFLDVYDTRYFNAIDYDNVIKMLCDEYENATYIDVHDLELPMYISEDKIHYNELFYNKLYDRFYDVLRNEQIAKRQGNY